MAQHGTRCNCVCPVTEVTDGADGDARGCGVRWTPAQVHQPMYWPPFADRFAPVIQLASSGMKNATA